MEHHTKSTNPGALFFFLYLFLVLPFPQAGCKQDIRKDLNLRMCSQFASPGLLYIPNNPKSHKSHFGLQESRTKARTRSQKVENRKDVQACIGTGIPAETSKVWVICCVSVLFSNCKRRSKPQRTDFSTRGGVLSCFLRLKRYVAVANVVSRVARCVIQRHATLPQVVAAQGCFHILRRTQEHANQMQTDPDCMRKQALNPQPIFSSFWELVFRRVHCQAAEMHHKQTQTAPISQLEIRAR